MARVPCEEAKEKLNELKLNQREIHDQLKIFHFTGDQEVWDRLGIMRHRQENLSAQMRYELPIGMDFERAKRIMGREGFFGAEETREKLDWSTGFNERDMGPIPFSPKELHDAVEEGQFLIHRFSKDLSGDDVTMKYLRMNAPNRMESREWLEGLFAGLEQYGLENETIKPGWYLGQLTSKQFAGNPPKLGPNEHTAAEFYYDGIVTNALIKNAQEVRNGKIQFALKSGNMTLVLTLDFNDALEVKSELSRFIGGERNQIFRTFQRFE
jgi:hypothetical protein